MQMETLATFWFLSLEGLEMGSGYGSCMHTFLLKSPSSEQPKCSLPLFRVIVLAPAGGVSAVLCYPFAVTQGWLASNCLICSVAVEENPLP